MGCSASGLYYNKSWNKDTPDALFIELCEDNRFKFYVWQDIIGEGIESGTYQQIGDTLIFHPAKRFQKPVTKVKAFTSDRSKTRLQFYTIHALGDTISLGYGDTLVVNDDRLPLDSTGVVELMATPNDSIQIQPLLVDFLSLEDTNFLLDTTKNEFIFYISQGEWQPFSYYMAQGKMLQEGRRLYDIDSTGTVKKDFVWKRHKLGCGHIKWKAAPNNMHL